MLWKKFRRDIRLAVLAVLMCAACACSKPNTGLPVTGEKSDMSQYINFADQDTHIYYDLTIRGMADAMDDKRTFVVYFGYDTCEWCLDAVPVINDAAKETGYTVGYINTRANPAWQKNTDMDDYDLLIEKAGEFLDYDADGVRHLYAPTLFFIKEGKVVAIHEGTLEGHNARIRAMTAEEREELKGILLEKFHLLDDDSEKN